MDNKISKKELIELYGISYPTLRKRLRDVGLEIFVGRRRFELAELVLIFQALGKPVLARRAAARLMEVYALLTGHSYGTPPAAAPASHQDQLPDSPAEIDLPPTPVAATAPLRDALCRLRLAVIPLMVVRRTYYVLRPIWKGEVVLRRTYYVY